MAHPVPASDLRPGDVYRGTIIGLEVVRGQAYAVQSIRTVVTGATYRVIDAINVLTGNHASIDLRADVKVVKLTEVDRRDVCAALDSMTEGSQFSVVCHDGKLWW